MITGSRFGIVVPVWLMTVPLPVLAPVCVEALVVMCIAMACTIVLVIYQRKVIARTGSLAV